MLSGNLKQERRCDMIRVETDTQLRFSSFSFLNSGMGIADIYHKYEK